MKTIVLASNNKHKIKEVKEILDNVNIITLNGRIGEKADLTDASFKLGFPKNYGNEDYEKRR